MRAKIHTKYIHFSYLVYKVSLHNLSFVFWLISVVLVPDNDGSGDIQLTKALFLLFVE